MQAPRLSLKGDFFNSSRDPSVFASGPLEEEPGVRQPRPEDSFMTGLDDLTGGLPLDTEKMRKEPTFSVPEMKIALMFAHRAIKTSFEG
jgi:hypothetical protein